MLLVEQRSDDDVQTYRLTLTRSTGYEQMRNLRKVCHEHLIGDGLSEHDRQVVLRLLKLLRVQNTFHRYIMALFVRHLNTDSALAWDWCNDTHAESRKA